MPPNTKQQLCIKPTGFLVVFRNRDPVRPHHMRSTLKTILQFAGFDHKLYDTHSFHIGAASWLLQLGISVETIKNSPIKG